MRIRVGDKVRVTAGQYTYFDAAGKFIGGHVTMRYVGLIGEVKENTVVEVRKDKHSDSMYTPPVEYDYEEISVVFSDGKVEIIPKDCLELLR